MSPLNPFKFLREIVMESKKTAVPPEPPEPVLSQSPLSQPRQLSTESYLQQHSSVDTLQWLLSDALPMEMAKLDMKNDDFLLIRVSADIPPEAMQNLAVLMERVCEGKRRFAILTDDMDVSIVRDKVGMVGLWHGAPQC